MIKRLILGLLLAMLAPAAPAFAQASVEEAAANLQGLVGKEYEGGIKFVSATAEGDTLVLTVDGQQGWAGMSSEDITGIFLSAYCESPKIVEFLKKHWIRVDMLDRGANLLKGKPVNTCPAEEE